MRIGKIWNKLADPKNVPRLFAFCLGIILVVGFVVPDALRGPDSHARHCRHSLYGGLQYERMASLCGNLQGKRLEKHRHSRADLRPYGHLRPGRRHRCRLGGGFGLWENQEERLNLN